MNEIKIFENDQFGQINVLLDENNEPLFKASDVCTALGYSNPRDAVAKHVDEDDVAKRDAIDSIGRNQQVNYVTESGLYALVFGSKLESAKAFKKWVTSEVLPSVRKTLNTLDSITYKGSIDGIVSSVEGVATTTSEKIAEVFGMEHKSVIRAITDKLNQFDVRDGERLAQNCADVTERCTENSADVAKFLRQHIKDGVYIDSYGRPQRNYILDEQGFDFIALGFTGAKADEYKARYISAFYTMKQALMNMFKARVLEEVLPQNSKLRQYIYVIKNPFTEYIKIGVTQDVPKRVKQLQTGAGVELELVYKSMICSNAFEVEAKAHKYFEDRKVFGEWFDVKVVDAIKFIESQEFTLNSEFSNILKPNF